jgi:translation initiation factor RLI1
MSWVSPSEYESHGLETDNGSELNHVMDRDINLLSGGELQRFAIGTVCVQQADVYGSLYTPRIFHADDI